MVDLDPDESESGQTAPDWNVSIDGTFVRQLNNCNPGLAVVKIQFVGVDFEATIAIDHSWDDDYIGIVFAYQVQNSRSKANFP